MDRRSFLLGLGVAAFSQGLMGCRRGSFSVLQVSMLASSLPSQLVSKFQSQFNAEVDLKLALTSSPAFLFEALQRRSAHPTADPQKKSWMDSMGQFIFGAPQSTTALTSLGDFWLQTAIAQNLIRPWSMEQLHGWQTLDPIWQQMVRRDRQGNPSATGELWGAPYRWGATVIAYRKDKFHKLGWTPTDWSDLWRPELKNKISVLDQPREVIGLTLKKLGQSYNTEDLASIPTLTAELKALHQQVKLYSSQNYLQPLLLEDTWVAVGWSTDVLPALQEDSEIAFVVPKSGTALWSDLWVWPQAGAPQAKAIEQWVEFWWKPEVAAALAKFSDAVSTIPTQAIPSVATAAFVSNSDWFKRSETLAPLSKSALQRYQTLWQQIRA